MWLDDSAVAAFPRSLFRRRTTVIDILFGLVFEARVVCLHSHPSISSMILIYFDLIRLVISNAHNIVPLVILADLYCGSEFIFYTQQASCRFADDLFLLLLLLTPHLAPASSPSDGVGRGSVTFATAELHLIHRVLGVQLPSSCLKLALPGCEYFKQLRSAGQQNVSTSRLLFVIRGTHMTGHRPVVFYPTRPVRAASNIPRYFNRVPS